LSAAYIFLPENVKGTVYGEGEGEGKGKGKGKGRSRSEVEELGSRSEVRGPSPLLPGLNLGPPLSLSLPLSLKLVLSLSLNVGRLSILTPGDRLTAELKHNGRLKCRSIC
jgi:hypothetical protein